LFILCNIPAIIQWRKKFQPAGMFVLGNLILIGGQFLFLIAKTGGGTEDNTFTIYYYLEFSLICQVIIFSKGIGDRINIMRKESEQAQEKAMLQLETKVKERTQQLNEQKLLVEEQNQEIKDSITYAKRIQEAILPNSNAVKETFPDSFVLYQPKDIVAGDFYWMEKSDELINFAVADCTGHGVPGAMVSIVCHNALNRSVREYNCTEPAAILDNTRKLVIDSLSKNKMDVKDGMDISLISYDPKKMNILFAGANNGLYLIRNNELTNYKSDRQPIGVFEDQKPFNQQNIDLQKGDVIYLFTDGFADQFGGEKGKKLKTSNFKSLLLEIHQLTMEEQKEKLQESFENWRNDIEQIDDLCIAGIRF
jgi:serine phosphatase RsbU (regulator of sigma subunit)